MSCVGTLVQWRAELHLPRLCCVIHFPAFTATWQTLACSKSPSTFIKLSFFKPLAHSRGLRMRQLAISRIPRLAVPSMFLPYRSLHTVALVPSHLSSFPPSLCRNRRPVVFVWFLFLFLFRWYRFVDCFSSLHPTAGNAGRLATLLIYTNT